MVVVERLGCLLLLIAVCGCGSDNSDTVPATGTVTLEGKPVEGAYVAFGPASGSGSAASGTTDASGRFSLTTFEKDDGAVPGAFTVQISKTETTGSGMTSEQEHAATIAGKPIPASKTVEKLPTNYKSGKTSGLTAEVKADGENDFKFDLKNKK